MSVSINILGTDYDIATTTAIYLSNRNLTSIPDSISLLVNLRILDLDDNDIEYIPDCILSLVNLQHLILSDNLITTIPDCISLLVNCLLYTSDAADE